MLGRCKWRRRRKVSSKKLDEDSNRGVGDVDGKRDNDEKESEEGENTGAEEI